MGGFTVHPTAVSPSQSRTHCRLMSGVSTGGGGGGTAPVSGGSPSYGGAIALTKDCSGTRLENCTLADNAAINGVGGDLAVLAAPSGR